MRGQRGFTLIEVVIALSLVSLVMLGLIGAMRTFGASATRLEARSISLDELRLVPAFMDSILSRAVWRSLNLVSDDGSVGSFKGGREGAQWLGVMPGRHGMGGMSHMRLTVIEMYGERVLALQVLPFVGDAAPDWSAVEPEVVVNQLRSVRFRYLAADGGEWQLLWEDPSTLPGWVSLEVTTMSGAWPLMIFRLLSS